MNDILAPVLMIAGMALGGVLYLVPFRLFYRQTTWMTEEEFLAAFPEKWWVTRAMYGLLPLGFAAFSVLMASTNDRRDGIIPFFFFPIFFCCFGALPAIPELVAKASVRLPVGHGAKGSVVYALSPNASRAGVFRLSVAFLVVVVFLWCR